MWVYENSMQEQLTPGYLYAEFLVRNIVMTILYFCQSIGNKLQYVEISEGTKIFEQEEEINVVGESQAENRQEVVHEINTTADPSEREAHDVHIPDLPEKPQVPETYCKLCKIECFSVIFMCFSSRLCKIECFSVISMCFSVYVNAKGAIITIGLPSEISARMQISIAV
ncbi:hypothetical protein KSP40_PGU014479 [Platanthera guangdongensis]|uniref:Uncharacterized protein n=1 Tax=Platanthera guangdongensis TaxID=2320717 RepID=A0ABR2MTC9_9ASPA